MPKSVRSIYLQPQSQKEILHRLSRVIGQAEGLKRALQRKETCEELLIQASAVRSAMGQVMIRLLEGHMQTCVLNDLRRGSVPKTVAKLRKALTTVLRRT